ncbi:MAG: hypothetical protein HRU19_02095 [Pseudobacteriovorax sp.]|nr:hypothetical protein [Pseudobacteriovorax sp.]
MKLLTVIFVLSMLFTGCATDPYEPPSIKDGISGTGIQPCPADSDKLKQWKREGKACKIN